MKLIDEIYSRRNFGDKATRDTLSTFIDKGQVFVVDNVAKYFFEYSDKDEWNLFEDFPNIAPQFEYMFFEFGTPKIINANGRIIDVPDYGQKRVGVFIESHIVDRDEAKWVMIAIPIQLFKDGRILKYDVLWEIGINAHGEIARLDSSPTGRDYRVGYGKQVMTVMKAIGRKDFLREFLDVCLLSISFMHCKNVELIKSPVLKPTKKRRQHDPHIRYYTLNIRPMQRVLEEQGQAQKTGLKLALHICRGHFKDYSKGDGLFGKYKGLYWWDSQVRGDIKQGAVIKDYEVKEPPPPTPQDQES